MRRGFTILEVLIALAIFAMAAVVLGSAYVNVLTAYERARVAGQADQDIKFARAALLAEADPEAVAAGGDFTGDNGRTLRWKGTIEPTATADLFRVTFECDISGGDMKQPQTFTETFMVLRPTWSVGTDKATLRAESKRRIDELNVTLGLTSQ